MRRAFRALNRRSAVLRLGYDYRSVSSYLETQIPACDFHSVRQRNNSVFVLDRSSVRAYNLNDHSPFGKILVMGHV